MRIPGKASEKAGHSLASVLKCPTAQAVVHEVISGSEALDLDLAGPMRHRYLLLTLHGVYMQNSGERTSLRRLSVAVDSKDRDGPLCVSCQAERLQ